jgi:hypothetical protein
MFWPSNNIIACKRFGKLFTGIDVSTLLTVTLSIERTYSSSLYSSSQYYSRSVTAFIFALFRLGLPEGHCSFLHLYAKWFLMPHLLHTFPHAGHSSFLRACECPQNWQFMSLSVLNNTNDWLCIMYRLQYHNYLSWVLWLIDHNTTPLAIRSQQLAENIHFISCNNTLPSGRWLGPLVKGLRLLSLALSMSGSLSVRAWMSFPALAGPWLAILALSAPPCTAVLLSQLECYFPTLFVTLCPFVKGLIEWAAKQSLVFWNNASFCLKMSLALRWLWKNRDSMFSRRL